MSSGARHGGIPGNIVSRHFELVREVTGQAPTRTQASTTFLREDHKDAPAAMPHSKGHGMVCPWCRHSFAEAGAAPAAKKVKKKGPGINDGDANDMSASAGGRLKPIAASGLAQVLYVARMARDDLKHLAHDDQNGDDDGDEDDGDGDAKIAAF